MSRGDQELPELSLCGPQMQPSSSTSVLSSDQLVSPLQGPAQRPQKGTSPKRKLSRILRRAEGMGGGDGQGAVRH